MLDVKKHVLEKRLRLYAALHKVIMRNTDLIAPPALMERYYWSLIDGMPFRIGDQKMEYVSYFGSYDKLNEYCLLLEYGSPKSVFLPKDIEQILQMVNDWYGVVQDILTAFKMVEAEDASLTDKQRKEHLDLACQMYGIALQYDIEYVSNHLKGILADRLQMPSLLNLFKASVYNRFRFWFFQFKYDRLDLYKKTSYLIAMLLYVHISDRYSRNEYEELPDEQKETMLDEFHASFIKYIPDDGDFTSDSDRD